jgi:hypothetical protein
MLAVQGSYTYIGVGPRLVVVDVGHAAAPQQVGQSKALPDILWGIAVAGNLAYVAAGDAGLWVIDVSDPTAPREVGACDTPGEGLGVAVAGNMAYVADGWGGLMILRYPPLPPRAWLPMGLRQPTP